MNYVLFLCFKGRADHSAVPYIFYGTEIGQFLAKCKALCYRKRENDNGNSRRGFLKRT